MGRWMKLLMNVQTRRQMDGWMDGRTCEQMEGEMEG